MLAQFNEVLLTLVPRFDRATQTGLLRQGYSDRATQTGLLRQTPVRFDGVTLLHGTTLLRRCSLVQAPP
jgi:hypothetical protein